MVGFSCGLLSRRIFDGIVFSRTNITRDSTSLGNAVQGAQVGAPKLLAVPAYVGALTMWFVQVARGTNRICHLHGATTFVAFRTSLPFAIFAPADITLHNDARLTELNGRFP